MLTVDVSPADSGTITLNGNTAPDYPATHSFYDGDSVLLEAVPAAGYEFAGWERGADGNDNPVSILIDCNKKVTARFSQKTTNWWLIVLAGGGTTIFGLAAWIVAWRNH